MQGIESLNNFKKFVSSLGGLGRYEDTYIVHAAEGETVVPMEVLDKNPALKKRLFQSMIEMGIEPGRYIVGNELNSKNPVTGQPEFFLKKIVSQIRKALPGDTEQFLGPIVGLATGSLPLGAIAGAIGSGVPGAIGGGIAGLRSPGLALFRESDFNYMPVTKKGFVDPLKLSDLLDPSKLRGAFFGEGDKSGIFGKFDFTKGDTTGGEVGKKIINIKGTDIEIPSDELEKAVEGSKLVKDGFSVMDAAKLVGLGTVGLGLLIQLTTEDQDVGLERDMTQGNVLTNLTPKTL